MAKKIRSRPNQTIRKAPGAQQIDSLVALFNLGRYKDVEAGARQMTGQFPLYSFGWATLGLVLQQLGKNAEALMPLKKSVELAPGDAQALSNLGNTLCALGKLEEAESVYRRALAVNGTFAEGYVNLGATLHEMKRYDEAEASYRAAIKIKPNLADAHFNLANTFKQRGSFGEAEESYRRALHFNPNLVSAYSNMGALLREWGRLGEAEAALRTAIQLRPDCVEAYSNLGSTLHDLGRLEDACAMYYRGLQISPGHASILSNLGNALHDMGRLFDAKETYLQALEENPALPQARSNLGNTLQAMGYLDEATDCYRRALETDPHYLKARSNLLFASNYSNRWSPAYCAAEARSYGQIVSGSAASPYAQWTCEAKPERLRIGFVSADLRNHPVGYFLEKVLEQLVCAPVELYAYPTHHKTDDLTSRIKPYFSSWTPLVGLSDAAAARVIHEDRIHVLVDLAGHTQYNRLPVFAWKPAPVQVSWLGYFATTGVNEIDYVIGDNYVAPASESMHFVEKIWRLPACYWCFSEPEYKFEVSPLPAEMSGSITFGSFNNLSKMNDDVVSVWSSILARVPESRLFLKYSQLNDPRMRDLTIRRYAKHGIPSERLILEGTSSRAEYLACYNRVDIALDPFPYPGGTTSIEGLWMGVPFITKVGDRFLSHAGETIAHNAGLSDWVALDEDDYVSMAVRYASDTKYLSSLRGILRLQVLASPLFDAASFARNFEAALRSMWKLRLG